MSYLRRLVVLCAVAAPLIVLAAPAHAIVGGDPAPPGRWPWAAVMLDRSQPRAAFGVQCSATIIAPRLALTAGHCAIDTNPHGIDVLVGRTRLTGTEGRRIPVDAISVYPGYANASEPGLDAAVLKLRHATKVTPLPLARPGQEALWAPGTPAWVIGWGRLNAKVTPGGNEFFADRLRQLQEPIASDDACERVYGSGWSDYPYEPDWEVCAGTSDDRTGTCFGDSGAPLMVQTPDGWLGVSLDVASDSCAGRGYYDLGTRVDRISEWALGSRRVAQPVALTRPRVLHRAGRLRCAPGRWRGHHVRLEVRRQRVGRHGLRCVVTARNAGGRMTVASRPVAQKPSR